MFIGCPSALNGRKSSEGETKETNSSGMKKKNEWERKTNKNEVDSLGGLRGPRLDVVAGLKKGSGDGFWREGEQKHY